MFLFSLGGGAHPHKKQKHEMTGTKTKKVDIKSIKRSEAVVTATSRGF
jgi:hypothetical protein